MRKAIDKKITVREFKLIIYDKEKQTTSPFYCSVPIEFTTNPKKLAGFIVEDIEFWAYKPKAYSLCDIEIGDTYTLRCQMSWPELLRTAHVEYVNDENVVRA